MAKTKLSNEEQLGELERTLDSALLERSEKPSEPNRKRVDEIMAEIAGLRQRIKDELRVERARAERAEVERAEKEQADRAEREHEIRQRAKTVLASARGYDDALDKLMEAILVLRSEARAMTDLAKANGGAVPDYSSGSDAALYRRLIHVLAAAWPASPSFEFDSTDRYTRPLAEIMADNLKGVLDE